MQACIIGRAISLAGALLFFLSGAAGAQEPVGLYSATTIITGTLDEEKRRGFAACLLEVLVKVSGDLDLSASPKMAALAATAEGFVEAYTLRDRMAGIPVHDEQGTRERPHLLNATFSKAKIDEALRTLGRSPWLNRPTITILVGIDNGARHFVVSRDSPVGVDQREALSEIAARFGLKIAVPDEAALAAVPIDFAAVDAADRRRLDVLRRALGGTVLLSGALVWNEEALRWTSHWHLVSGENAGTWVSSGVSFDEVFRDALANAMRSLGPGGDR